MPAERTKNGKAHIVHLSETAWAVISEHLGESEGYVLRPHGERTFRPSTRLNGHSIACAELPIGDYMTYGERSCPAWHA